MTITETIARAVFRAGFHPDEDEAHVAEKWAEWEDKRHLTLGMTANALTALTEAGYAIVPVEPTPSMISGAWKAITAEKQHLGIARLGPGPGAREVYRAMITAALDTKEGE